jgi:hypothetical protein
VHSNGGGLVKLDQTCCNQTRPAGLTGGLIIVIGHVGREMDETSVLRYITYGTGSLWPADLFIRLLRIKKSWQSMCSLAIQGGCSRNSNQMYSIQSSLSCSLL